MPTSQQELANLLNFGREVCHEAGRLTLGYFHRRLEIINKADGSPVTVADREAETLIRRAIEQRYPHHGINGEEFGVKEAASGCSYTWFIDPIDGTKSFIHGVPLYTCLLGLLRAEESVVGIVQVPGLDDQLSAGKDLGCFLNGIPVRTSAVNSLAESVVLTTDPHDIERRAPKDGWKKLWEKAKFVRTWGDAYGHFLVATGRAEVMLDPVVNPYDIAPLPVIMRESGGAFFDWNGKETIFSGNGISTNGPLKEFVQQQLD